jgi:hypothetical protein
MWMQEEIYTLWTRMLLYSETVIQEAEDIEGSSSDEE